ncbi:MAG: response regulator [Leptospira sp.]|nr:response regulator [Leptospira sp.]NCS95322.1 response regulator [Leptospira sp.]
MKKPDIPINEKERIEALKGFLILDSHSEKDFDDITKLASIICKVPIALISLIDSNRQWFKSKIGLDVSETPRDISFCGHAINHSEELFIIPDSRKDSRFFDNPLVTGDPNVIFYAGSPLLDDKGHVLGTLCVIDNKPKQMTDEQKLALRSLSNQVVNAMTLRRNNLILANENYIAKRRAEIFEETNLVAKVGGWEVDLVENSLYWSKVTKEIHDVDDDYIPILEESINFYSTIEYKKKIEDLVKDAIATGESWETVLQIVSAKGILKWVRAKGIPKFENGKCIRLYGSFQDITNDYNTKELIKKKEEQLSIILDSLEEVVWAVSLPDYIPLYTSKSFEKLYGREVKEYYKNINIWKEVVHKDDLSTIVEFEKSLIYFQYSTANYRIMRPDGSIRWVENTTKIIKDDTGKPIYITGMLIDITEKKEIENQLVNLKEIAEAASKAKSDFLANMSHEIRTPLNGVIGFSEMLMNSKLDPSQRRYMNIVNQSAHSLLDLINDILDFSKIEAGKMELNREKVDRVDLIEQSLDLVKYKAIEKGLDLVIDIDYENFLIIEADPLRLRQILVNILSNAIKFTSKGEVEISSKILSMNKELNLLKIEFSVKDTGIGISKEDQGKIFEVFSQADSTTSRKYGGSGLGLSISNNLLSLMDSKLNIESDTGRGSKFSFILDCKYFLESEKKRENFVNIKNILIIEKSEKSALNIIKILELYTISSQLILSKDPKLNDNALLESISNFDIIFIDQSVCILRKLLLTNILKAIENSKKSIRIILLTNTLNKMDLTDIDSKKHKILTLTKPLTESYINNVLDDISSNFSIDKINDPKKNKTTILEKIKVLVAEDNPVNLLLTKSLVKRILPNSIVESAENGIEAIEKYEIFSPDIILMDVQMPELNGLQATRSIRNLNKENTIIIALTAGTTQGEEENCMNSGMNDFISKPIQFDILNSKIQKWIKKI